MERKIGVVHPFATKRIPTSVWPRRGSSLFWIASQRRVRREWKFGTINSNGGYVLGDLLLVVVHPPPAPLGPRLARSGCPRTSPGTRSFSPIEFNGYPRRLIYWMRSFAPPARNDFATVAHRCRPLCSMGGKERGGARSASVRKFLFLRAWKFVSSIHLHAKKETIFLFTYGMGWFDLERFGSEGFFLRI